MVAKLRAAVLVAAALGASPAFTLPILPLLVESAATNSAQASANSYETPVLAASSISASTDVPTELLPLATTDNVLPTPVVSEDGSLPAVTNEEQPVESSTVSQTSTIVAAESLSTVESPEVDSTSMDSPVLALNYPPPAYQVAPPAIQSDDSVSPILYSVSGGITPPDWNTTLNGLINAAATSVLDGDPADLLKFAISLAVSVFGFSTGTSGPTLAQFQEDVDQRLETIQGEISNLQSTMNQVVQIVSNIEVDIKNDELNNILNAMIPQASAIDNAFERFSANVNAIAAGNASPQNYQDLYDMLNEEAPSTLITALTTYQSYVTGYGGSRGVLAFMPNIVQNAWQECAMGLSQGTSGAQNYANTTLAFIDREGLMEPVDFPNDGQGPLWDSPGWILNSCVNTTFTTLGDAAGYSVESVFGAILGTQLKAMIVLSAALANSTTYAPLLNQATHNAALVGAGMAALWPSVTNSTSVDAFGSQLLVTYGATLGTPRADTQFWWNYATLGPNDPPLSHPYQSRPANGPIEPNYLTGATIGDNPAFEPFYPLLGQPNGYAYIFDPSQIAFPSGSNSVNITVTAFMPFRWYSQTNEPSAAKAPWCWCGTSDCSQDAMNQNCAGLGAGWQFISTTDTDWQGNQCTAGYSWVCGWRSTTQLEYAYMTVPNGVTLSAPHTAIPTPPPFIQSLVQVYVDGNIR